MPQNLKVDELGEGERLDKFLHRLFPQYSRAHLQKQIKQGLVTVNQKKVSVHNFLKIGDEVEFDLKEPEQIDLSPDKKEKLDIVFENDDFFVINKKAGVVVHPSLSYRGKTLVNALLAIFPPLEKVGEDRLRPGIVHRLDKEVSGLMVVAKTWPAFEHFKNQFKEHKIKKEYLALVHGLVEKNEGEIDFPIHRGKNGKIVAGPKTSEGKPALTHFELVRYLGPYSLLKLRTFTGRSHQVRVHLKALGHPIVGDELYKNKKIKDKLPLKRIFLHAKTLGFFDPKNHWQEFENKLPEELEAYLQKIT